MFCCAAAEEGECSEVLDEPGKEEEGSKVLDEPGKEEDPEGSVCDMIAVNAEAAYGDHTPVKGRWPGWRDGRVLGPEAEQRTQRCGGSLAAHKDPKNWRDVSTGQLRVDSM